MNKALKVPEPDSKYLAASNRDRAPCAVFARLSKGSSKCAEGELRPVVGESQAKCTNRKASNIRVAASEDDNSAYVCFDNVHKTYDGETLVVNNLDLGIAKGEFLTLLGPSGSGKTTTLMMLAGFESPTHGKILLDGRELNRVPPHRRNIGMVFQNYALFPHMTVQENLAFPLKTRKKPASEISERVERVLDMVHLGQFAKLKWPPKFGQVLKVESA